jgi:hypothetical protein
MILRFVQFPSERQSPLPQKCAFGALSKNNSVASLNIFATFSHGNFVLAQWENGKLFKKS